MDGWVGDAGLFIVSSIRRQVTQFKGTDVLANVPLFPLFTVVQMSMHCVLYMSL